VSRSQAGQRVILSQQQLSPLQVRPTEVSSSLTLGPEQRFSLFLGKLGIGLGHV
jgi:hypothetical protein